MIEEVIPVSTSPQVYYKFYTSYYIVFETKLFNEGSNFSCRPEIVNCIFLLLKNMFKIKNMCKIQVMHVFIQIYLFIQNI